jgi:hypothetical protein
MMESQPARLDVRPYRRSPLEIGAVGPQGRGRQGSVRRRGFDERGCNRHSLATLLFLPGWERKNRDRSGSWPLSAPIGSWPRSVLSSIGVMPTLFGPSSRFTFRRCPVPAVCRVFPIFLSRRRQGELRRPAWLYSLVLSGARLIRANIPGDVGCRRPATPVMRRRPCGVATMNAAPERSPWLKVGRGGRRAPMGAALMYVREGGRSIALVTRGSLSPGVATRRVSA